MPRVLIVEDEDAVAELVADVLQMEGYDTQVTLGISAYQQVLAFIPHLVLLDLMMPEVDGFEVARRLRGDPSTRHIPIVIMTAVHDPRAHLARIGVETYLAKPFDIDELLSTVSRVLALG